MCRPKALRSESPLEKKNRMIGFIMPNRQGKNIYRYAVSVDDVEEATGFDFFSGLPKSQQDLLESQCNPNEWNK